MLNYLLAPTFQYINTAGRPLSGGAYLEVYIHGTRDKYYCASDFEGNLHPFQIPLDSLGANVVLAEDSGSYDVYAYNRYGSLIMSRYNVKPGSGGGSGMGSITSSDGSIEVTPTSTGVDLKVNGQEPSVLRATADDLDEDGAYTFSALVIDGTELSVDENGRIRMEDGWYHYDATVRLVWENSVNDSATVQLYTTLNSDVLEFDLSYAHDETVQLGGEMKVTTGGTSFVLGVSGLPNGMVAQLVDLGIHTITGHGDAAGYEAGDGIIIDDHEISIDPSVVQEKLTAGDNIQISEQNVISATDTTYTAGTGLDLDGTEFSVDTSEIQEKLTAGSNIVIEGNTISATAEPQLQANWTENDSSSVQYIQNKPANLVQDADYTHTDNNFTDAEKSKLAGIESGAEVNVQSDWTVSDSSDDAYIKHKPGTKQVAAGDNITITEGNDAFTISATDTTYTAGQNITITNNVISATAAPQLQSNWTEADTTSVQYIQNKPDLSVYATTQAMNTALAGKQDVISDLATIRSGAALGATSVQDVTVDGVSVVSNGTAAITLPDELVPTVTSGDNAKVLTAAYDSVSGTGSYSWASPAGLLVAVYGTTTYAEVHAAVEAGKIVYCSVSGGAGTGAGAGRMAFLAFRNPGWNYEFQYYRSNGSSSGTDSVFVYKLNSNNTWETTERTVKAGNISYPVTTVNVNGSSAMSGTVANINVPAQEQADWAEADMTATDYIKNKPNLALKEDVSNKSQTLIASSTTDYPSSAATAQFVNSSIATATAHFLGNYSLTDLGLTYPATDSQIETALDVYSFQSAPTNNDYVYVEIQNPQTTSVDDVVKRFKFNGTNWLYEYTLNNSSFTAAEIAAIDSGVNATKVGNYDTHIADTTIHVTAADKTAWNGKQDAISDLSTIRSGAALGATSVQPSDLATVATTGDYGDLLNAPTLAAVATSGDYTDLSNTPHIPVIGTVTL